MKNVISLMIFLFSSVAFANEAPDGSAQLSGILTVSRDSVAQIVRRFSERTGDAQLDLEDYQAFVPVFRREVEERTLAFERTLQNVVFKRLQPLVERYGQILDSDETPELKGVLLQSLRPILGSVTLLAQRDYQAAIGTLRRIRVPNSCQSTVCGALVESDHRLFHMLVDTHIAKPIEVRFADGFSIQILPR